MFVCFISGRLPHVHFYGWLTKQTQQGSGDWGHKKHARGIYAHKWHLHPCARLGWGVRTCSSSCTHRWHCCPTEKLSGEGGRRSREGSKRQMWSDKARRRRKATEGDGSGQKVTISDGRRIPPPDWLERRHRHELQLHRRTVSTCSWGKYLQRDGRVFLKTGDMRFGKMCDTKCLFFCFYEFSWGSEPSSVFQLKSLCVLITCTKHIYKTTLDMTCRLLKVPIFILIPWLNHWVLFSIHIQCWVCWTLLSVYAWRDL